MITGLKKSGVCAFSTVTQLARGLAEGC